MNFFDNSRQNMEMENVVMLEGNQPIVQEFTADGSVLSNIKIRVFTKPGTEPSSLFVALKDKETGEYRYEKDGDTYGIKENTALYSFLKKEIPVQKGRTYAAGASKRCGRRRRHWSLLCNR